MKLWTIPTQAYRSLNTAVNSTRPAALFKNPPLHFERGTVNADLGGGRFDAATEYLATLGVRNVIWDPFARSEEQNRRAVETIAQRRAHSVTVTNVLNVIAEAANRSKLIAEAADAVAPGGLALFQIYEGDRTGIGRCTKPDCWQENRKTESYLPEIAAHFAAVERRGNIIIAE